MNNDDQKIFEQGKGRYNACLQNYMGFAQLARYYLESANTLIERAIDESSKLDVYVYSAVFLYRHSVELQLKELIWMSNFLLGRGKTFPKHHRLVEMWQTLKSNATSLLTPDFPLNKKEVQYIETTLREVMKCDPESDSFRYPLDKKMQRPHSDVNHINVKSLHERFNRIHEYFGQISYVVDYFYEAQAFCDNY